MSHARPYVAAAAVAIFVQGCGGSAEMSPAKSVQDLGTPDGALAALDQAERSLDQLLGGSVSVTIGQSASQSAQLAPPQPPPAPPAPAPQASSAPSSPPGAHRAGGEQPAKGGRGWADAPRQEAVPADACSNVCTSLASMERAADRLCGLTGEGDGRCASARARVKTAAARVHAACPACS